MPLHFEPHRVPMSSDSPSFHGYIDVRSLTLDWSNAKRQEETKFFAGNCEPTIAARITSRQVRATFVRSNVERKGLFFLLLFLNITLDKDCSRVNAGSPFYRSSDRDSPKIVTLVNREHDATYDRSYLLKVFYRSWWNATKKKYKSLDRVKKISLARDTSW